MGLEQIDECLAVAGMKFIHLFISGIVCLYRPYRCTENGCDGSSMREHSVGVVEYPSTFDERWTEAQFVLNPHLDLPQTRTAWIVSPLVEHVILTEAVHRHEISSVFESVTAESLPGGEG